MSELISIGILAILAAWGYGCCRAGDARIEKTAPDENAPRKTPRKMLLTPFLLMGLLLLLSPETRVVFGQPAISSVLKADPVQWNAVTGGFKSQINAKEAKANFLRQPLSFEATKGQGTPAVNYVSRGPGYTLILSGADSAFVLPGTRSRAGQSVLRMQLADADSAAIPHAEKPLQGRSNYFLGNDPAQWRRGVEQFAQVRLPGVYPGIDLIYYGNQRQLEHDFVVAPGADPNQIRMKFLGAASQTIGSQGNLLMKTPQGQAISFEKPFAWQTMADGSRHSVSAEYSLLADRQVGFRLGHFDPALPLTIDPVVITYSTYFGGSGFDSIDDIKVDAQGNIYLLMATTSVDLPVLSQIADACVGVCGASNPSTPDQSVISHDIYLAKLDPTGQQMLYSTYIGGSADDAPGSFTIASDGSIYIAGETMSKNFPLVHEYSSKPAPPDYYGAPLYSTTLTRLSADGNAILYSTLIGGGLYNQDPGQDNPNAWGAPNSVAAGANGVAYLLGYAETAVTGGGYGPFVDAKNSPFTAGTGSYVAKFDTTLTGGDSLLYAQTFGQPGTPIAENLVGIAIDSQQNLWVVGNAGTTPITTPNAVQPICDAGIGCQSLFLFELNPVGAIPYATFLGGTENSGGGPGIDHVTAIFIDPADNIYLGGQTESIDFPTKNAAWTFATTNSSHGTGFLTKLSPGALSILYSTYLPWIYPVEIAANPSGVAVATESIAGGFPVVNELPNSPPGYSFDAAFEIFDTTQSGSASLLISSYLGSGSGYGYTTVLTAAFDSAGDLVLGGTTNATDFPVVNPHQSSCSGETASNGCPLSDGFLSRIKITQAVTLTPASLTFGSETVGATPAAQTATLTNNGISAIAFSTPALSDSTDFAESDTCNGTVAAGGSCVFQFTFSPKSSGALSSTFSVSTTSSPVGTYSVTLSGTGIAATPVLTLTPSTYSFGTLIAGNTASTTLTLKNTGNAPANTLSFSDATVYQNTGQNVPSSTLTSTNNCPQSLAAGASCSVFATFIPGASSSVEYTLYVGYGNGAIATSATLTGTGIAGTPVLTLTPSTYSFGTLIAGNTASTTLTLKNTGNAPANTLSFSDATVYQNTSQNVPSSTITSTNNCPQSLAAGASCSVFATFIPGASSSVKYTLYVGYGNGTIATSATLTGTGIAPPPPTLSPSVLSFGNVTVGANSPAQTVTFTNPGSFPLSFTSIGLVGTGFSIQASGTTCKVGPSVAAGGSCTLAVIFAPATAGALSGSLTVNLPAGLAVSSLSVLLTGTGVPAVVSPENIDFVNGFTPNGMNLNGAATVSGGVLQLTANQPSQASAAFYPTPVSTTSFSTDFAFQLLDPLAEGITFTIQANGPTAIGSNDGGLGYQGIANSIALKFDLRDTNGEGNNSTGIYVDGAPPTVPATSLAASGIDLHSGDVFALHLSYDGTTESITLMDTATGALWTTQAAENIPAIVGSSQAYFGFTASTGVATVTPAAAESAKPAAAAATVNVGTTANIIYWKYADQSDGVAALSPIQLNFGNVTVGSTSTVQSALLTNTGTAQFQVSSITPSDPSIVVHSSYCARPVTPGSYCKVEVQVAPTAAGAFTGSVVIAYYLGDGSDPSQNFSSTLAVTATGIASPVILTPASADFGNVPVTMTSSSKLFTVTNGGTTAVSLAQVTIVGTFQIAAGATCISGMQLPGGKSCTIPVAFAPVAAGSSTGTLFVSYFGTSGGPVTKTSSLTGTGAVPVLTLTPSSYSFGTVTLDKNPSTTLTLKNSGNAPAAVLISFFQKVSNTPGDPFSSFGETSNCPTSLAVDASCEIVVIFTPVSGNQNTATVSVSAPGAPTVNTTLTGAGAVLTVTPANLNFGDVGIYATSATQTLTLTNVSSAPVYMVEVGNELVAFSYSNCANHKYVNQILMPGESCVLAFQFHPTALSTGPTTEVFSIQYYPGAHIPSPGSGTLTVGLTGTAQSQPPPTVTPASLDFGRVALGTSSAAQTLTLTNVSSAPVYLVEVGNELVAFSYLNCANHKYVDQILMPGESCVLAFQFHPTAFSTRPTTEVFSIQYYPGAHIPSPGSGTLTVGLTGTDIAPPETIPYIDFGSGFTADALTLTGPTNIASGALQLTAGPSSAASSAFYPTTVPSTTFNTDFTFQLLDPTAEGVTFTIQGDGPNAVGAGGGGLGYQGLAKSIALKFDLKDTAGEGLDSTGIYVNGAPPTVPAISLASSGIDLHSGHVFDLQLTYDGKLLSVTLRDTVTQGIWTTQAAEDIPAIVGGNTAYFGFTAGSGTPALTSNATASVRPDAAASATSQPPAASKILTWIYVANGQTKSAQTITFPSLSAQTYGMAPIPLAATASSGLPVTYAVTGPAKLSGAKLTITGAGAVTVTASQSGNASYLAAPSISRSFTVARASLAATATNLTRAVGASNPALTYTLSGFVDGDTILVVSGTAALATTALPTSPAGRYPIAFSTENLAAANYSFNYVAGTLTITPGTLVIAPLSGNFGSIAVGKTSPVISFIVTNNTTSTMGYLGYANLGEFYLQPGTCHLVNGEPMLNPGQSCVFTAVFKPTKPGPASGNLSIKTSSGTFNVPMMGTGSTLVISPATGNFGNVTVGQSSPVMSFTVTNDTPSTMGYLGYANLGEFYLQPGTCHLVNGKPMLNPSQSCVFTAVFKPTKAGPASGNLSIQTSSGIFNVPMTGTGVTP